MQKNQNQVKTSKKYTKQAKNINIQNKQKNIKTQEKTFIKTLKIK